MLVSNPTFAAAAAALLSALPAVSASLYLKSSPVVQVDAKSYDRLVAKSNYTTALEFYAPWCGHCQNLKPAWEKAAKNLDGLARIAAVNCDEDANKPLCGQFAIQGFPTIKIVRPGKKPGRPVVEDYNGPRSAKGIVEAVVDKINNHVKRVGDKDIDAFLAANNDTAKALLFTEKGTTSALLKSIAIDFLGVIQVAQVRNKEAKTVELFGVESYPSLVLLPGGDAPGLLYDGEMKKEPMVKFLSQAGAPNPDPAPEKPKAKKEKKEKKKKTEKAAPEAKKEEETITVSLDDDEPAAAETKAADVAPPIPALTDPAALVKECLNPKAGTCVLAVVPAAHGEAAEQVLGGLAELAHKYRHAGRVMFPAFEIHAEDAHVAALLGRLELATADMAAKPELVAVNGKRGWWRRYEGEATAEAVEAWLDAIRMSEGVKRKLPAGVLSDVPAEAAPTVEVQVEDEVTVELGSEPDASASWHGAEPTPEATEAPEHERDEL